MNDILYSVILTLDQEVADWTTELFAVEELYPTGCFEKKETTADLNFYAETFEEGKILEERVRELMRVWSEHQELGQWSVEFTKIVKEDWAETWKRFFKPVKVSDRLVVKPTWEDYSAAEGEVILEIDPGMSFGTGGHGTTRACLDFIDKLSGLYEGGSFMDMGCGSGILSIAASKLGFESIDAFDFDAVAVGIAQENLDLNNCANVNAFVQDLNEYEPKVQYDLVVANILPHVLSPNAETIISSMKKEESSRLVLSGILHEQYDALVAQFAEYGLVEADRCRLDEWSSGCLKWL